MKPTSASQDASQDDSRDGAQLVRTQVSLTEEQMMRLRELGHRRGTSIAAVVRAAVEAELRRDERSLVVDRAREAVGAFRSGCDDLGRAHDEHFAEAVTDEPA